MRAAALWLTVILPGLLVTVVSSYYLLRDWAALGRAFARWEHLAATSADARSLMIADTYQQVFRMNCFAEGVGVLLGVILAAIGIHGLCVLNRTK
jgi:predicted PurR-regulated permease PerM